jgi:hypothetical protein
MVSTDDPFASIGGTDPGSVPAEETMKMAQKPLANIAQPTLQVRPRLSAFAENGEYTLEGQELEIQSAENCESKYGPGIRMGLLDGAGTVHQVFTSAKNIVGAIDEFNKAVAEGTAEYPIVAVFRKIAIQGGNTCWVIE